MRIGGLATGMDTDQLVKDLMKAERIPLDKLFQQKQIAEWQRDDYRDINLSLSSLRNLASNLRFQSSYIAYSMTSTNPNAVTVEATGNTTPGTYNVSVTSLAKAAKLNSTASITDGSGNNVKAADKILTAGAASETFTITNAKGQTATITVTDQDTYANLASKIANAVDDATGESLGLRANFDDTTSRFFISSKEMGGDVSFTFQDTAFVRSKIMGDPAVNAAALTATGSYGSLTFDGITVNNLKTNTTTVNGVKMNLLQEGQSASLSVQSDSTAVFDKIKAFVDEYNKFIEKVEGELYEKRYRDFPPLTKEQREAMSEKEIELWEEKAKSGMLRNDPILQSIKNDLRQSLLDPVTGIPAGELNMLAQVGVNTGTYENGGKLFIDEDKLKKAIEENPDEVMRLFAGDSTIDGVGDRVYAKMDELIKRLSDKAGSPSGSLIDNSVISKQIKDYDQRITAFEDRLIMIEDRYWRQFTAMEKAINQMNQQSAWMMQNMFGGA